MDTKKFVAMASSRMRGKFAGILLALQVVFLVLFAIFVEYKYPKSLDHESNELHHYYSMFQDVHVMIFVGFGFLMTFLKRYGFGSVGLNMLIAAFILQWATLMLGFLELHDGKIQVDITSLLKADFAAAAVLISFGALLGKVSPLQLIILSLCEIVIFSVNEYIGVVIFKAVDMGGSMFVHVFGAYFGITVARILYNGDVERHEEKEGSVYHSDLFAMIGTIFLWLFWPSFNSALAPGDDQHRAVINTYYALAACTVVTFAISAVVNKEDKFDMVHIQNATLAGGVAVGTASDMLVRPWGALLIGSVAGILSVIGYKFITPFMASKLKLHDTCGVNNLHGMPGILAAVAGAIATAMAKESDYGLSMYRQFAARAPTEDSNSTLLADIQAIYPDVEAGDGRTAATQAGYQMVAFALTLGMAIVGGVITGFILKIPIWDQSKGPQVFDDTDYWELPEDGFPGGHSNERTYTAGDMGKVNGSDETSKV